MPYYGSLARGLGEALNDIDGGDVLHSDGDDGRGSPVPGINRVKCAYIEPRGRQEITLTL